MSNDIVKIEAKDLSLVHDNSLNEKQLALLLKRTPKQYVRQRPAKGGGTWDYVSGGYVRKVLNLMFGWDWDFKVLSEQIIGQQVVVKGELTCRCGGRSIVKHQFGCKDIICRKGTTDPLNIGNDFKAAATDALKKCAAEIGVASDIYNKDDFREINVDTSTIDEINDRKERDRLSKFIASATTREQLEPIRETAELLGLFDKYQIKYAEL